MSKSKSAASQAAQKDAESSVTAARPGKRGARETAPAAAKSGTDTGHKGEKSTPNVKQMESSEPESARSKTRPGHDSVATDKLETRSTKAVKESHREPKDGVDDDFEKTAVSKVSEVATKTSKSTPSVSQDVPVLSEAQILKMSDKDYMNPAQLAFFKARLQALEKELLKNAGETTEHLRETVLVPDPADRATIEEEHALELRTRDRERKLLKKVQQSIVAIDAGDYGWCEETGEPIGIPRLLARPTATLSLEAQQRRELKQKLYGD